ncbi:putative aflatoxin biosynthesis ketoreductase nor-1 [Xylariales sp. AK1849]|nr:putative aflatoxin biosynthesis ketoreductase nor-1 [Xylariales sp. AK1849]
MATAQTTILITGANRGIGKGLIEASLSEPDHTVIAAVRDPSTSEPLNQLPVAKGSRLVVVKLDATIEADAAAAIKELSTGQLPNPNAAYGPTKAAAHWLTKRINTEEKNITSFAIHPGWVATDMGNLGASNVGLREAPTSIKDSAGGILEITKKATKDTHGGTFWQFDGKPYAW